MVGSHVLTSCIYGNIVLNNFYYMLIPVNTTDGTRSVYD